MVPGQIHENRDDQINKNDAKDQDSNIKIPPFPVNFDIC